jgi:hypothetical protein|tara:strand:- start:20373 stop:21074 length:702 start_codon:yes stop_codon:yes gene_type:complete
MNTEYILESSKSAKSNSREKHIYGDKLVFVKDVLPYGFNLDYVIETIENIVPRAFVENVDAIYIGKFNDFNKDKSLPFNAKYKDGALYITNEQDNENDMIDDIIHELAHAVEEKYGSYLYSDGDIESEFRGKRQTLYHYLEQEGYQPSEEQLNNIEYDKKLDYYLFNIVGYPTLTSLTVGLFYSPYSITSINEYFANGFENFFLRDSDYLRKISPILYNKISNLLDDNNIEGE